MSPTLSSTATTPRSSVELAKDALKVDTSSLVSYASHTETSQSSGKLNRAWQTVKRHAREHHESVNAVYALYYGQGYERQVLMGGERVRAMSGEKRGEWQYERGVYGGS